MRGPGRAGRAALVAAVAGSVVGAAVPALAGTAAAAPVTRAAASGACAWSATALPQLPGAFSGYVYGTDGDRQLAGRSGDRPVLWRDGRAVPLGWSGTARDVNRRGEAVGEAGDVGHAALWRGKVQIQLAEPPGFTSSTATGIDDTGLVVGFGSGPDTAGAQGLVWRTSAPHQVRVLAAPGGGALFLSGVDQGVVVGTEVAESDVRSTALIGTPASGLRPLAGLPGTTDSGAAAIAGDQVVGNDSGGPVRWVGGVAERLPGGGVATAVGADGTAAGYNGPPEVAYAWTGGARVDLPGLTAGGFTGATAVTDDGRIAGFSSAPGTGDGEIRYEPVVWTCG